MNSKLLLTAIGGLLLSTAASAHVELTSPNGGESLQGQDQFLIEWYDIVTDLPYTDGISAYAWTVPDLDTTQARIKVIMILNANDHWDDISDGDFNIHASDQSYGAGTVPKRWLPAVRPTAHPLEFSSPFFKKLNSAG